MNDQGPPFHIADKGDLLPPRRPHQAVASACHRQGHAPRVLVAVAVRVAEIAVLIEPVRHYQFAPEVTDVQRELASLDGWDGAAAEAPGRPGHRPLCSGQVFPEEKRLRRRQSVEQGRRVGDTIGVSVEEEDALPAAGQQRHRLGLPAAQHAQSRLQGRQVADLHSLHAGQVVRKHRLGGAAVPDLHGQPAAGVAQHLHRHHNARPVAAAADQHDTGTSPRAGGRQRRSRQVGQRHRGAAESLAGPAPIPAAPGRSSPSGIGSSSPGTISRGGPVGAASGSGSPHKRRWNVPFSEGSTHQ